MLKSRINTFFNYLLTNSHKSWCLYLLEKTMNNKIPFNLSHKFKFLEMSENRTQLLAPYIKSNKNHLGGIHACTVATVGEYTAGLTLIKNFDLFHYRVIMQEIQVKYMKQATGPVTAKAELSPKLKENMKRELALDSKTSFELVTEITNAAGEEIAKVSTKWQLKEWKKVSFKA